jgi:O-antigen ligase
MHNLLQAYVLGAYVAALATVYNYLAGAGIEKTYNRFAAQGFDANDLGMLLALGLPMAWYLASAVPSGLQRWGNRGYFLVAILALLLTGSRGALVASLVALSVVPFTIGHLRTGVKVAGLVIIILAAVAAIRFVPEKSFERLSSTTTEISEGTLTGRLVIWQRGLALVPERPLHGYGPAGWFPSVGFIGLRIRSSHNTYLSILVEEGLIGLLLYLSMFAVVLRRLRALPSFERKVGTALMATLMTAILPLNWDVYKASWLVLALLAGWADVLARSHPAPVRAPTSRTPLRRPRVGPTPVTTR